MDSQQILSLRHVAEITTKNEGLHVLGIRFYYWLPVNLLKVYRRRRPSILGNRGRALITSRALCSLPVTLLSSPWHRCLHTCPWIGSWTSIVETSLRQRASGGSWYSDHTKSNNCAANLRVRDRSLWPREARSQPIR